MERSKSQQKNQQQVNRGGPPDLFAEARSQGPSTAGPAAVAIRFLEKLRPGGPWVLCAIDPEDGRIETITAENAASVRAFVNKYNGRRNVYYSLNPTKQPMSKKPSKADISQIEYLPLDLDARSGEQPRDAKERYLKAFKEYGLVPAFIVDSGNCINAAVRLKRPRFLSGNSAQDADKIADIELRTLALTLALGGTRGTQNIDRILRLPGTTNIPTPKKQKEGRVRCLSKLMEFNDAAYRLDAFPPTETDNAGSASSQQKTKDDTGSKSSEKKTKQYKTFTPVDVDTLPVPQRIKNLIRGKDDPKHPYSSRSEPVMAVLVAMASAGCSDVLMTDVMFDISLPLGKHVREQSNPEKYAARQIQQARKAATDPDVAKLNEQYALIIVGDKIAILQTEPDLSEPDSIERDSFKLLQLSAFNQWHENQFVTRGDKNLPLAKFWLKHPQRRQYKGMVFAPTRKVTGHFNLWRGFAVKSKPGDCSKFLAHIKDNVCQGSDELYRWVIGCSHRSLSIRTKR